MEPKLKLACVMGCLMMSTSTLLVAGCGDDSAKSSSTPERGDGGAASTTGGTDSVPLAGADSGDTGGTRPGHGGSTGKGGSDGSGGTTDKGGSDGNGARPTVDPNGGSDNPGPDMPGAGGVDGGEDSLDFDGVDLSDVPEDAPTGCVGGFDPATGTLAIEIAASVVRLAVPDGVIQANGVDCESEAGDPARADQVGSLSVSGSAGDDTLYLDASEGAFSAALAADGAISVALGGGNDRVSVLGTNDADVIFVGSDADQLVVDLNGDARVDLTVDGSPAIVISTGAKKDEVH